MVEATFGLEAKHKLSEGVSVLAEAVGATLGAAGRNVVIEEGYGIPHVTKDGVTVARSIELKDPIANMGAQMVKEVAIKTNDEVGDGTTTATVLADAMIQRGLELITKHVNPVQVKKGMNQACQDIIQKIKESAIPVKEDMASLKNVASVSANNDEEIGEIVVTALRSVNKNGIISVEQSNDMETYIDVVNGMELNRGYITPYFITDMNKMNCVLEDALILITDIRLSNTQDILDKLDYAVREHKSLLIISPNVEGELLTTLIRNKVGGVIRVAAIKAPGYGAKQKDVMQDIAILTGGKFISNEEGINIQDTDVDILGSAKKVVISKDKTLIIEGGGKKEDVAARIEQIQSQKNSLTNAYDKEQLNMRAAKLAGGVAVLYVGAATEVEMKEKKDRVDDALAATRAAVEEGIVPGAGMCLFNIAEEYFNRTLAHADLTPTDYEMGCDLVYKALYRPSNLILENAGLDIHEFSDELFAEPNKAFGVDSLKGEVVDLYEKGIIDPAKVEIVALRYAVSVASTILTVECTINNEKVVDSSK